MGDCPEVLLRPFPNKEAGRVEESAVWTLSPLVRGDRNGEGNENGREDDAETGEVSDAGCCEGVWNVTPVRSGNNGGGSRPAEGVSAHKRGTKRQRRARV